MCARVRVCAGVRMCARARVRACACLFVVGGGKGHVCRHLATWPWTPGSVMSADAP